MNQEQCMICGTGNDLLVPGHQRDNLYEHEEEMVDYYCEKCMMNNHVYNCPSCHNVYGNKDVDGEEEKCFRCEKKFNYNELFSGGNDEYLCLECCEEAALDHD